MSKIYGITGGIATGKSFISEIIKNKGYQVFDADKIARKVSESKTILKKISDKFGEEVVKNNQIDRQLLGEIVFGNKKKLDELNEIMLPVIETEITGIIEDVHKKLDNKPYFIEIPLLFEQGYEKKLDKTIVIFVDEKTQLQRLISRDEIDKKFAEKKISSQMSLAEKVKKADYVIDNSSSQEVLEQMIDQRLIELNTNL